MRIWTNQISTCGKDVAVGLIVYALYGLSRAIGLRKSRRVLGSLAAFIGPKIRNDRSAEKNLKLALPTLSPQERAAIREGMWRNIGYIIAEYCHGEKLKIFDSPSVTIVGEENLQKIKNDGLPALIFSGHMGSWVMIALALMEAGLPVSQVYRPANNPMVNRLLQRLQNRAGCKLIPKGPEGGRKSLESLQSGDHMVILIDQKMNNGISVPFFGHEAMTPPGLARLAQRFNCPVMPIQVERIEIDRFRITFHDPFFYDHGEGEEGQRTFMIHVHGFLEKWILQHPDQWLWLHNRWPNNMDK